MLWTIVIVILVVFLLWDRVDLWTKAKGLPGPFFSIPFIGQTIQMVMSPFPFYANQEVFGPLSWNSAGGKFILFSKSSELTRNVFSNAKGSLRLWLIFGAEAILGKENLAFMHGPEHKAVRHSLLPLFTKKALSTYLHLQEAKIHEYIDKWCDYTASGAQPIRIGARDINIDTSLTVFVGPYIPYEIRPHFTESYFQMNEGMLSFPIALPGTTLWKAIKAREKLIVILTEAVLKSKEKMRQPGSTPECLLDYWMEDWLKDDDPPVKTDNDIAFHVLDFLFASQDASTSSITWAVQLLADHPDVLDRVRTEQAIVRPANEAISQENLAQMKYTHMVVKEILRYRPPATMVPHIAVEDWKIQDKDDSYTVKKGSVILPSIWCSSFENYENPYTFDPDRFNEVRQEHIKYSKNFLVFGLGPHLCIGKEYAMNHLTAFVAILAAEYDWQHFRTDKSDVIKFLPTIFPEDDCVVQIKRRSSSSSCC